MIEEIILNVLAAFYQPFWAAFIASFAFMYLYLFAFDAENGNKGWKAALSRWIEQFKKSAKFRSIFFLFFYAMLVLFKTILNRNAWINPLKNVFGGWWIWETDTTGNLILSTACIENLILLLPFSLIYLKVKEVETKISVSSCIINGTVATLMFSIFIELIQLIFRIGNFQFSDLFYNTLGGFIGGLIYWIGYWIKHRK